MPIDIPEKNSYSIFEFVPKCANHMEKKAEEVSLRAAFSLIVGLISAIAYSILCDVFAPAAKSAWGFEVVWLLATLSTLTWSVFTPFEKEIENLPKEYPQNTIFENYEIAKKVYFACQAAIQKGISATYTEVCMKEWANKAIRLRREVGEIIDEIGHATNDVSLSTEDYKKQIDNGRAVYCVKVTKLHKHLKKRFHLRIPIV